MSTTTTTTLTAATNTPNPVYNLTLSLVTTVERVRKPLNAIIESMKTSSTFDAESQKAIVLWESSFWKESLSSDQERLNASDRICALICEVIRPRLLKLHKENSSQDLTTMISFEDQLKEILGIILPTEEDVETFINGYEESAIQQDHLSQRISALQLESNSVIQNLYSSFHQVNAKLKENFDKTKDQFKKSDHEQFAATMQFSEQVGTLSQKINQTVTTQSHLSVQVKQTGEQLKSQLAVFEKILIASQTLK